MRQIATQIEAMSMIAGQVSDAVGQQKTATQEIASSVQQTARLPWRFRKNIRNVKEAATNTGTAAAQVQTTARELAKETASLQDVIRGFVEDVRAA